MFVTSHANKEGTTLKPTQKSATASETINALVLVRRFRLLQTRKIVNPFPVMARKERTHPRIQNQVSIRTNGRKEKFLLTTQIKQKCPLHKNVRRLYVIHCQMYVTRLKSFLLSYFVINLVISNMCFACAVGN